MAAAAVLVLTAVIGGTIAAPSIQANKTGDTTINIEDMEVALAASTGAQVTEVTVGNAVPGHRIDCANYVVKNTVKDGYDLYARVTIDKQWKAADGTVDTSLDADMMKLYYAAGVELTANSLPEGWIAMSDANDKEQIVLYYTKPLKSSETGDVTSAFLSEVVFSTEMDNKYTDKTATINITVDAVQASIAEKAMLSEWGVAPTLTEDGVITAINE